MSDSSINSSANESSSNESTDSSSSDSDLEVDNVLNSDFFRALSYLKKKDPVIYDPSVKFFNISSENSTEQKVNYDEETSKVNNSNLSIKSSVNNKLSYFQRALEDSNASDDDDEDIKFKVHDENDEAENNIEPEHVSYLKGKQGSLYDKNTECELKPLYEIWNSENLDPEEKFLKDYILNKRFLEKYDNKEVEVDLSEDEKELEEQEEFEEKYNKRFETEENLTIKRYPRNIGGSLRRKNDSRSQKRAEIAQRKKDEKMIKHKELKKTQKKKLVEIQEKLNQLKELTGNRQLGFKDEEILDDFDPEKHDKKMNELFNDEFYAEEDHEMPIFDNFGNIDDDNFNMDCDADWDEIKKEKLTRSQRKKNRKKKSFQEILDIEKPSFDPNTHEDFKKYLDEYYSIDCEDFIDDLPCRFKYKEVVPNDFGLSVEEILMADDKELNQWASVKKLQRLRPEHLERNEIKVYRAKAKNDALKKKILRSLYAEPVEETAEKTTENLEISQHNETVGKKNNKTKKENTILPTNNEYSVNNENSMILSVKSHDLKKKIKKVIQTEIMDELEEGDLQLNEQSKKQNENDSEDEGVNETSNVINSESKKKRRKMKNKNNLTKTADQIGKENSELDSKIKTQTGSEDEVNEKSNNHIHSELGSKKKKRKKKKKASGLQKDTNSSKSNVFKKQQKGNTEKNVELSSVHKKSKNKFKSSKNNIVNLSDSRLLAYGIKPKKFRSKIIYGDNN